MRIAIDTGGTFTDCVWVEEGRVRMLKVFSTPRDPSQAIVDAIGRVLANQMSSMTDTVVLHGTTVGTNALLERRGARVAFVTTKGFEDTIEIGRQARPKLYDFFFDRVPPLVPSHMRFGVPERVASTGKVLREASRADMAAIVNAVAAAKPESIAISFLFSFANPASERAAADALAEWLPEVPISVSHVILPEFREYERASTVVVNAYLQPLMQRYFRNLHSELTKRIARKNGASVFVMQSSGGITSLETAGREPVRTVLSGPAGGVVGAAAMGRASGFERVIGFDMGGTSTDVALVAGALRASVEAEVAGLPVRVPMLDIHTVGAGGGSLARFDAAGALRVGPESAGADPGPICYGRGEQPTVTDANLLLGRLQPDAFLGGDFKLEVDRARRITTAWLKRSAAKLTLEQFAEGVIRVANSTMEKAIRVVSIERGYDPRDFTLVAFGGAGGLHACALARSLGIPRVLVPQLPGALSAYGILVSEVVKDYSRTVLMRVDAASRNWKANLERLYRALEHSAAGDFKEERWRGKPHFNRSADVRYRGQGFELNVAFGPKVLVDFHAEHQRRYGYSHPERDVEIVTVRLRATLPAPPVTLARQRAAQRTAKSVTRQVWFDGKPVRTRIYAREELGAGKIQRGPAVVTEYSATTVIPPRATFKIDRTGALLIEVPRK
jgi:N-methylhydantoinase A